MKNVIQKAIFLPREAGVDLGYQYNWYLMGPYSPGLAQDYFNLDHSVEVKVLHPKIENRLDALRGLFSVPNEVPLNQAEWLELVRVDSIRSIRTSND